MGYRSEIIIAYNKKVETELLLETLKLPKILLEIHEDSKYVEEDLGYYYYHIIETKWYASYPEVQECIDFIDELVADHEDDFAFVRIGEDLDDFEELGVPWDFDIGIQRYIQSPFE